MIVFFSGNGNSATIARRLKERRADDGDALGFVFPVYGWRPPRILMKWLAAHRAERPQATYVWAVMTCGDDAGYCDRALERALGRRLDAAWTVRMPDTYLALPGFRLDAPDEAKAKIAAAERAVDEIAAALRARARVRNVRRGIFPWVKTALVGRFFDRFLVSRRFVRIDAAKCRKCGLCARNCPCGWTDCTGCQRCYHNCPADALEYGRFTKGKGRLKSGAKGGIIYL
jgi:ferredoxin